MLEIVTITKDDDAGLRGTVSSTRELRLRGVVQTVIDGSRREGESMPEFLEGEPNLRYLRQDPAGISAAFNLGVESCSAEWIWFINGGDRVHPDLDLPLFMSLLERTSAEAVIFGLEMAESGRKPRHPPFYSLWPPLYWVPHPATVLKRELFDRYGRFTTDLAIAMDAELWIRFFCQGIPVDLVSIPIALFDEGGVSYSQLSRVESEADSIIFRNFRLLLRTWLRSGNYLYTGMKRHLLSRF